MVAVAKNAVLKRKVKTVMPQAQPTSRQSQQTEHVYSETWYVAGKWNYPRRVIIKAEVIRHSRLKARSFSPNAA